LTNDGKENIVDDYCALTAATELYKATKKEVYREAADRRAKSLLSRLIARGPYHDYWRADSEDRPFFHASDAGFPVVSLLYYSEIAGSKTKAEILATVRKSLSSQWALTNDVANPFGCARQLVQDKTGKRRTSFFFPHNSDAAPWWQGENARLASLAAAANLLAKQLPDNPDFQNKLRSFSANQLNWILGLNPFDSSMMNGIGRNNPQYMFFDSWEFTNAPGGISNGITSGFRDEDDIDYNLTYKQTGADNDWRWQEQGLPPSHVPRASPLALCACPMFPARPFLLPQHRYPAGCRLHLRGHRRGSRSDSPVFETHPATRRGDPPPVAFRAAAEFVLA